MLLKRLIVLVCLALAPAAASAQEVKVLDQAVVDRAVAYLNGARSMSARFVQRDQHGGYWTGNLWMHRPGRLRFEYDPPEKDVIWADNGGIVQHFDAELETVTHMPRHLTAAWFLLDDEVAIDDDDVTLMAAVQSGDRYFVTASQKNLLTEGRVTLAFAAKPDRLLGWTVTDADGAVTQVELVDLAVNVDLDLDIFNYSPPVRD